MPVALILIIIAGLITIILLMIEGLITIILIIKVCQPVLGTY